MSDIEMITSWMIEHVKNSVLHVYRTLIVFYHIRYFFLVSLIGRT